MPDKCSIGLKTVRGGLLGCQKRNMGTIYERQKKMSFEINKWIREDKRIRKGVPERIIDLMRRMLEYDSKKRPTPQQIIDELYR